MAPSPPNVYVHDTGTGHDCYVSESRFRNPPKAGLWERLDQGKPKASVATAAAKKQATSGHEADSKKETA